MNLTEKILASKLLPGQGEYVKPNDAVLSASTPATRTSSRPRRSICSSPTSTAITALKNPAKFAVFEDHLIYATGVPAMAKFAAKIELLRVKQKEFAARTGVRNFSAVDGVSPGICHQVAREHFIDPGDFVQATDSHTCMGGASGALAWGVGATEYAALLYWGFTPLAVPESIRFELQGKLPPGTSAKDVMLHILATYAKREDTLNRVMEFGGEGLFALSPDERATLANMATECSARGAVMEVDDTMLQWIAERRPGHRVAALRAKVVTPDPGAEHAGGIHTIDLAAIRPMVATPGDPDRGIASDPKNGALVREIGERQDRHRVRRLVHRRQARRHRHVRARARRSRGRGREDRRRASDFFIQFGSREVEDYAKERGYIDLVRSAPA